MQKVRVDDSTGCWLWTARIDASGYGRFQRGHGISPMAHRHSYEHFVGPIPAGLQIDHLCRVRNCVNPEHLEVVTNRENAMRGQSVSAKNAAKTHCSEGHELSGDNIRIIRRRRGTERACIACARARQRAYKARKRAERKATT